MSEFLLVLTRVYIIINCYLTVPLKDQEKRLKERLIDEQQRATTLEKMSKEANAKHEQQQQQQQKSVYTSGDQRPAALVRKYGELYSQTRYIIS